ncbi:MAG: 30S ribosomal protein S17 [Schleiferiaceae bacterium]|jgi:small subunit ribosomal protein S17|nr:30S ribosomal protein S17 [Flavobacteriales bacterium]MDA9256005.1 30S ribosomal protein S17 [Schleiferiaceae bacterium]NCF57187.1 30S ribosomal protein S17 [Bacteroidota bacterium]NCG44163.1 30S ribosomal protein S17 [Pseudomonadota bacterium]MBT3571918.1 30S ribosomal protein S17 [Flavobacteriales bacterium]|tara:strand:+ start:13053 stop:13313 length:261 start_codon:yes stop_codon:yes gene_type:complete
MENQRNLRKERIGTITSSAMDKTVTVNVSRRVKHAKYGKFLTFSKKFHAHDEANDCGVGDTVRIMESRPISRTKCWRVVEIIERAK